MTAAAVDAALLESGAAVESDLFASAAAYDSTRAERLLQQCLLALLTDTDVAAAHATVDAHLLVSAAAVDADLLVSAVPADAAPEAVAVAAHAAFHIEKSAYDAVSLLVAADAAAAVDAAPPDPAAAVYAALPDAAAAVDDHRSASDADCSPFGSGILFVTAAAVDAHLLAYVADVCADAVDAADQPDAVPPFAPVAVEAVAAVPVQRATSGFSSSHHTKCPAAFSVEPALLPRTFSTLRPPPPPSAFFPPPSAACRSSFAAGHPPDTSLLPSYLETLPSRRWCRLDAYQDGVSWPALCRLDGSPSSSLSWERPATNSNSMALHQH